MTDDKDMVKLAGLAKIYLSAEEMKRFGADIETVMHKFTELDAYDVSGVQPLISPHAGFCPFREDEVKDRDMVAQMLANAPDSDEDKTFFAVPKVLEG